MNFAEFFHHLGVVLGILGADPTGSTALTTVNGRLTATPSPLIVETSTQYKSSLSPFTTKFIASLSTDIYNTTENGKGEKSTATSVGSSFAPNTTVTGHGNSNVTTASSVGSSFAPNTTVTGHGNSSVSPTNSTTAAATGTTQWGTETTNATEVTTTNTTSPVPESTTDGGNSTSNVTDNSTHESNATTPVVTEHTTDAGNTTGNVTENTTHESKATSEASSKGSTHGVSSTPPSTQVAPTDKGLGRGAVAGIVIGCLLAVAIITAAIVFVVKQRNSPEHQRLRV